MYRMLLPALVLALLGLATAPHARAQTTVFQETFDGVTEPDLPATALSGDESWTTSSSSESSGSGGNNLRHGGTTPGDIVFGPIDLVNASDVRVSYLARRTSSYPADSLVLSVSSDEGATWTMLMGPGTALPEATGEYESVTTPVPDSIAAGAVVQLRFRGYGGTSSGSNVRLDDITVSAVVDLSDVSDTFGFRSESSASDGSSAILPLDLAWTGVDSIQGLQFDVDFNETQLDLTGVTAGSPATGPGWTVDFHDNGGSARVLLLGGVEDVIAPGLYAGLLSLEFAPAAGSASGTVTTITLRDLVVSGHDPDGSDLPVVATPHEHQLTLQFATPSIMLSADSLALGSAVAGGSVTSILTVSNPTGDGDLVVSNATSSSVRFSADPTSFSVPPGESVDVEVSYAPTVTEFGFSSAVVTLAHNADEGTSQIAASATGTGGRGDVTIDGVVDVADVVAGIDAALGRTDPDAAAATIDVFPFPAGDASVDVRDLTVLVHAVMNGLWPDGVSLPTGAPLPNSALPSSAAPGPGKSTRPAIVLSGTKSGGTVLTVSAGVALRGIQIALNGLVAEPAVLMPDAREPVDDHTTTGEASFSRVSWDPASGRFMLLSASSGVVLTKTDRLEIQALPAGFEAGNVGVAVGITVDGDRLNLDVSDRRDTGSEQPESTVPALHVFPNPSSAGSLATIRIRRIESDPASDNGWRIRIVDLLGREVLSREFMRPDGDFVVDTSQLAPGLYFVRGSSGGNIRTVPLTIIR